MAGHFPLHAYLDAKLQNMLLVEPKAIPTTSTKYPQNMLLVEPKAIPTTSTEYPQNMSAVMAEPSLVTARDQPRYPQPNNGSTSDRAIKPLCRTNSTISLALPQASKYEAQRKPTQSAQFTTLITTTTTTTTTTTKILTNPATIIPITLTGYDAGDDVAVTGIILPDVPGLGAGGGFSGEHDEDNGQLAGVGSSEAKGFTTTILPNLHATSIKSKHAASCGSAATCGIISKCSCEAVTGAIPITFPESAAPPSMASKPTLPPYQYESVSMPLASKLKLTVKKSHSSLPFTSAVVAAAAAATAAGPTTKAESAKTTATVSLKNCGNPAVAASLLPTASTLMPNTLTTVVVPPAPTTATPRNSNQSMIYPRVEDPISSWSFERWRDVLTDTLQWIDNPASNPPDPWLQSRYYISNIETRYSLMETSETAPLFPNTIVYPLANLVVLFLCPQEEFWPRLQIVYPRLLRKFQTVENGECCLRTWYAIFLWLHQLYWHIGDHGWIMTETTYMQRTGFGWAMRPNATFEGYQKQNRLPFLNLVPLMYEMVTHLIYKVVPTFCSPLRFDPNNMTTTLQQLDLQFMIPPYRSFASPQETLYRLRSTMTKFPQQLNMGLFDIILYLGGVKNLTDWCHVLNASPCLVHDMSLSQMPLAFFGRDPPTLLSPTTIGAPIHAALIELFQQPVSVWAYWFLFSRHASTHGRFRIEILNDNEKQRALIPPLFAHYHYWAVVEPIESLWMDMFFQDWNYLPETCDRGSFQEFDQPYRSLSLLVQSYLDDWMFLLATFQYQYIAFSSFSSFPPASTFTPLVHNLVNNTPANATAICPFQPSSRTVLSFLQSFSASS